MVEHYISGYNPPIGDDIHSFLGSKEQTTIDAKVIGAGGRDVFEGRFGKEYFEGLGGISKRTLVMLLEYKNIKKAIFFPESKVVEIKSDAKVEWARELEGKSIGAILQYGKLVGIKI